jgi:hypothetical protein
MSEIGIYLRIGIVQSTPEISSYLVTGSLLVVRQLHGGHRKDSQTSMKAAEGASQHE